MLLTKYDEMLIFVLELACSDPRPFAYGNVIGTSYTPGSVVKFTCQSGFQLVGSSSLRCSKGQWFGTFPRCVGKKLLSTIIVILQSRYIFKNFDARGNLSSKS